MVDSIADCPIRTFVNTSYTPLDVVRDRLETSISLQKNQILNYKSQG